MKIFYYIIFSYLLFSINLLFNGFDSFKVWFTINCISILILILSLIVSIFYIKQQKKYIFTVCLCLVSLFIFSLWTYIPLSA